MQTGLRPKPKPQPRRYRFGGTSIDDDSSSELGSLVFEKPEMGSGATDFDPGEDLIKRTPRKNRIKSGINANSITLPGANTTLGNGATLNYFGSAASDTGSPTCDEEPDNPIVIIPSSPGVAMKDRIMEMHRSSKVKNMSQETEPIELGRKKGHLETEHFDLEENLRVMYAKQQIVEIGAVALERSKPYSMVLELGNQSLFESSNVSVQTVAGGGGCCKMGMQDGKTKDSLFHYPSGVTVDTEGIIYIADKWNHVVRRIDPGSNQVTTVAGVPGNSGGTDGAGRRALFSYPSAICYEKKNGNVFVGDSDDHRIRCLTPIGDVRTLPGIQDKDAIRAQSGSLDSLNTSALYVKRSRRQIPGTLTSSSIGFRYEYDPVRYPLRGIAFCPVYRDVFTTSVNDNRVREHSQVLGHELHTLCGVCDCGHMDGPASSSKFSSPAGLAYDDRGSILYVADMRNHAIRRITIGESWATDRIETLVETIAGHDNGRPGIEDGLGTKAGFWHPVGIALGGGGELFISERNGRRIRRVSSTGNVTTIAGTPLLEQSSSNAPRDGVGTEARFGNLGALCVDSKNRRLIVADLDAHSIKTIYATTITRNL